jgi:periplasmic divalent cation tolerance protein
MVSLGEKAAIAIACSCPSHDEAAAIARLLLEEKLIACAQLSAPVRSLYWWQGAICDENEVIVTMKSLASLYPRIEQAILAQHSYEVPEIVAWPLAMVSPAYLVWLAEVTDD